MTEDAHAKARSLADRFWDDLLELDPVIGTEVGDERFDDRLPDPSEEGRSRREQVHRSALRELDAIDPDDLDMVTRTTLDIMETIARRELASLEHRLDRFHSVTHLWGPSQLLADFASVQRADTPERLERYLGRLRAVPAYLDAVIAVAEEGASVGQASPRLVVDRTIGQVERLIASDPVDWPVMPPVKDSEEGRTRVASVIAEHVRPAYSRYLEALQGYRPRATESIGLSALPGGDAMYAATILAFTTLPLKAEEVHQTGVEDLERIQRERQQSAERLGHADPEKALAELHASGRNVAASREDMVRRAQEQVQRGWEAAPRFFGRLPRTNCEVRSVEEFREDDVPFAYYLPPSADNTRPGVYYVNTSSLAERPLHHLATTTYHEANPGHHFQISIEQEMGDRPPLRRFGGILASSAFIEGWGLYSERLADEMGLFADEYERMGMLEAQAWRACRLIVDTGIHALGWDRDRAIAKMEEAGVSRLEAEIEVDRYVALPGQALAYKIGQLEIERLRSEAKEREGRRFSLKDFHDRLLRVGSIPLGALEGELRRPPDKG